MKNHCIHYLFGLTLIVSPLSIDAQSRQAEALALGTIPAYNIEVTYDKTSHVIFPSGIRYVDLGSDYIVAGKAADADNVLRIKATVREFTEETNFSVITEDGHFYGFNVCYSSFPVAISYDLARLNRAVNHKHSAEVQFEDLNGPASLVGLLMETLYSNNRRDVKSITSHSYGVTFRVKGIYIQNGKYYFHIELENDSHVPFVPDFITFTIADRKVAKRTVMQEKVLEPLRAYRPLLPVKGQTTQRNIYLLDVFTLSEGQALFIEAIEKNGGRSQVLKIKNSDLVKAQPLERLRLKI